MKNKKRPPAWKQFEELVARIERLAAPHGAVVTSPDRVRDLHTGRMREVDAAIRQQVGTADILITIECRRHERKAGDMWIEQLATKKEKIGAAKTIAVSAAGFTSSAIVSARRYGIELRTLSKISAVDINNWFLRGSAVHVFRLVENVRCFITLYEDSGVPSDMGFFAPSCDDHVFHCDWINSPFPISVMMPIVERTRPEMFDPVPFDGTKVDLTFPIEWDRGQLLLAMTSGKQSVYRTDLHAIVSYESAVCELESGEHYEYTSPEGVLEQHTSFDTELLELQVRFDHQFGASGSHVAAEFKKRPEQSE